MDYSLYGYLSRRTKEELKQIIALYDHLRDDEYYKAILEMAEDILMEKINSEEL